MLQRRVVMLHAFAISCMLGLSPLQAAEPAELVELNLGTHSPGARFTTAIAAHNVSCKGRHDFELVLRDASWLTWTGSSDLKGIRKGKRKSTKVVVDTAGLPPGTHRGVVEVQCITCPPPPKCFQDRAAVKLVLNIRATQHVEETRGPALPGGLQAPSPSDPIGAARLPIFCVPRSGRMCNEPGFGCLVMYPASQWPAVRDRFSGAPVLDGEAMVLFGERPKLRYELRVPTEIERIPIDHDLPLDSSIATALGLPSATILEGEYAVDPTIGKLGGVVFDLEVGSSPSPSGSLPRLPPEEMGDLHNAVLAAVRDRFSPEVSNNEPEQRLDEIAAFVSSELARLRGLTPRQERQVRSLTRAQAHNLLGAYSNPDWSFRRVKAKIDRLRDEGLIADSDAELVVDLVATLTGRQKETSCQTMPPRQSEVGALRQDIAGLAARLDPRDTFSAHAVSIADSSIDFWEGNLPDPGGQAIAPWVAADVVGGVVSAASSALIQQGVNDEVDGEVVAWSFVSGAVVASTGAVGKVAKWVTSWF